MNEEQYLLPDPTKIKPKASENESEHELRDLGALLRSSTYLGFNANGDKVYERLSGRFVLANDDAVIPESDSMPRPMFLRCKTAADLRQNAAGLIKAIEQDESISAEDLPIFHLSTSNTTKK